MTSDSSQTNGRPDSPEAVCRDLRAAFARAGVARPMRIERYAPGDELTYDVTGVIPPRRAAVRMVIEKFVGGGFAGQVYRVKVLAVDGETVEGLSVGGRYAVKVLVPPSSARRQFRDALFAIGFQGPFSLQVNPDAARAGALWQKFIRRGAKLHFGDERAVVDVLATFFDERLGSCGEISEWIDGRNWRFEVDDHLDVRKAWVRGRPVDPAALGSPEYRAKRVFMAELVKLFHEMGAPELARQYEWSTCKSQPNVLKRLDAGPDPAAGLTAVDFRAGLALLACLPMSPGDFRLIVKGLARGSLVQFDRGDPDKLAAFVNAHPDAFADMGEALSELKRRDRAYRESLLDITHHHVRVLYDRSLWRSVMEGHLQAWLAKGIIDEAAEGVLRRRRMLAVAFAVLGLIPLLGRAIQKLLGRADVRVHYGRMLAEPGYLGRALDAHVAETLIGWVRAGAVCPERAQRMVLRCRRERLAEFGCLLAASAFPAGLMRMLTDPAFAWEKLRYLVRRPIMLYFNAAAREQWLLDMIGEGLRKGMLTDEEAEGIRQRIKDPYIQHYLKALAVHVCTLPVSEMVWVTLGIVLAIKYGRGVKEGLAIAGATIAAFQVTPVSPGSLIRGVYVMYLAAKNRNFRDYNIAIFLGFFKIVGYLAFPVQMAYRYPALARFMAGHWATEAVHAVPVFGEDGALLEHSVFDLFYNRLLTLRRRFAEFDAACAGVPPRYWHGGALAAAAGAAFGGFIWLRSGGGAAPGLLNCWYAIVLLPLIVGAAAVLLARGAPVARRLLAGTAAAAGAGLLSAFAYGAIATRIGWPVGPGETFSPFWAWTRVLLWPTLLFGLLGALGSFVAATRLKRGLSTFSAPLVAGRVSPPNPPHGKDRP